jgi:hypothetical protein
MVTKRSLGFTKAKFNGYHLDNIPTEDIISNH